MFHYLKAAAAAALLTTLAACASTVPEGPKVTDAPQVRAQVTVADMPDWFTKPPAVEGQWLFAAGTDTSSDPQFAVDRAILAATRALALQRAANIAATSRDFVTESGPVDARHQSGQADRATKLTVQAALGQWTVIETKLIPNGGQYRAYVLIRGPRPDAAQVVQAARTPAVVAADAAEAVAREKVRAEEERAARLAAERAFKELDKSEKPTSLPPEVAIHGQDDSWMTPEMRATALPDDQVLRNPTSAEVAAARAAPAEPPAMQAAPKPRILGQSLAPKESHPTADDKTTN